jgi:hypothetical protein
LKIVFGGQCRSHGNDGYANRDDDRDNECSADAENESPKSR